ncbi:agmatinase [Desulfurobacterium thermolithotrophum]|uniref:agmatinase n=1 Tax=Desulfurobacterium thermolithotrophum TaxID=64160 RepID=UPI0013CFAA6E|nr:agmatinase [Desulfurobacterium thermolithotrophum]
MVFLGASSQGKLSLFGIPYDSTTCFRPGARFAPDGIRFFSENLETYSPSLDKNLEAVRFKDLGNIDVPANPEKMIKTVENFMKNVEIPIMIGGEHSVTYPVVKSLFERYGSLTVIHFDAHADLRDEYSGTKYSHACVMKRVLELGCNLIQIGIRSGTKEEFELMKNSPEITYLPSPKDLPEILKSIKTPIYITIDIDFFDPAYAPGTGTPEPCGFSPIEFFETIYKLPPVKVVGFDVVEVSPPYDPSGITQMLGAKIVRELILKFWG